MHMFYLKYCRLAFYSLYNISFFFTENHIKLMYSILTHLLITQCFIKMSSLHIKYLFSIFCHVLLHLAACFIPFLSFFLIVSIYSTIFFSFCRLRCLWAVCWLYVLISINYTCTSRAEHLPPPLTKFLPSVILKKLT